MAQVSSIIAHVSAFHTFFFYLLLFDSSLISLGVGKEMFEIDLLGLYTIHTNQTVLSANLVPHQTHIQLPLHRVVDSN